MTTTPHHRHRHRHWQWPERPRWPPGGWTGCCRRHRTAWRGERGSTGGRRSRRRDRVRKKRHRPLRRWQRQRQHRLVPFESPRVAWWRRQVARKNDVDCIAVSTSVRRHFGLGTLVVKLGFARMKPSNGTAAQKRGSIDQKEDRIATGTRTRRNS